MLRSFPPPLDCQYSPTTLNLHACALGFANDGNGMQGGWRKAEYLVTSNDDSYGSEWNPGTLRYGLTQYESEGVYVTFQDPMEIQLTRPLELPSWTTLDGRSARVVLLNAAIVIAGKQQVLLHNLKLSAGTALVTVGISGSSSNIWLDHISFPDTNANSTVISVSEASTSITISNCYFKSTEQTLALGYGSEDGAMRVTVYRNWFDGAPRLGSSFGLSGFTVSAAVAAGASATSDSAAMQPFCRAGTCHLVNNYFRVWSYFCLGGASRANVRSDRNVFQAGADVKEVTAWKGSVGDLFDPSATVRSYSDLMLNFASFRNNVGDVDPFIPQYSLVYRAADYTLAAYLVGNCGPQVAVT